LTFDDGYADVSTSGVGLLAELGAKGIAFVVTDRVGAESDWPGVERVPLLDQEQLWTMAAGDVLELGSHTRTHAELTRLSDDELRTELDDAVLDLERLGLPAPRFLAYPYGDHDERVRSAAVPYLGAFTVDPGLAVAGVDPRRIPRISVRAGMTP